MPFLKGFSEIQAHKVLKTVSKHIVNNQMLIFLTMTPSDSDNSISASGNWWLPFTDAHAQSTPKFTPLSEHCFIDRSSVSCGASLCDWVACCGTFSYTTEQDSSQPSCLLPAQGYHVVPVCLKQQPLLF